MFSYSEKTGFPTFWPVFFLINVNHLLFWGFKMTLEVAWTQEKAVGEMVLLSI